MNKLPVIAPPAAGAQLATIDTAATAFTAWLERASRGYATSTVAAWESDLRDFQGWSATHPQPAGTSIPDTVAAYLSHLASRPGRDGGLTALATVRRHLATLTRLAAAGGMVGLGKNENIRLTMRELARARGNRQRQAAGLTKDNTASIRAEMRQRGETPRDIRDIALVMVGRDLLARASELVSLRVKDIAWDTDGTATVDLHRIKTGADTESYLSTETVTALRRWLEVASIDSGPVFVSLEKSGKPRVKDGVRVAIGTRDVSRILAQLAGRAGLDGDGSYSSHSMRVGMAQDLVAANIDSASILLAGGWKTDSMLVKYTRKLAAKRGAVARFHK